MTTSDLLSQAIKLAAAGDKAAALPMLAKVVSDDPKNEKAWLWLVDTMPSDTERVWALEECLKIIPESEAAKNVLKKLRSDWLGDTKSRILDAPTGSRNILRNESSTSILERIRKGGAKSGRAGDDHLRSSLVDLEKSELSGDQRTTEEVRWYRRIWVVIGIPALISGLIIFGGGIVGLWTNVRESEVQSAYLTEVDLSGSGAETLPPTHTSTITSVGTITPKPQSSTITPRPSNTAIPPVTILANAQWVDVGVRMEANQVLVIKAGGSWNHASGPARYNPDGMDGAYYGDAFLPEVTLGTLVAKIDENEPFRVGTYVETVVGESGNLYLAINDTPGTYRDNQGAAVADIQVLDPAP
jgi:hypothetical protein